MRKLPLFDSEVTRRDFIGTSAGMVAITLLSGCAPALVTHSLTPVDGKIRIDLGRYPELRKQYGSIKVHPDGEKSFIYVLAEGNNSYIALSPVCTHAGCIVDVIGDQLVCPCHKSIFDRKGAVLDGPAPTPLPMYPTSVDGNTLTITLKPVA